MIDPISLIAAAIFSYWANTRTDDYTRRLIMVFGAAAITGSLAALTAQLAAMEGASFRFIWAENVTAHFLQIWLICIIIRKWRRVGIQS